MRFRHSKLLHLFERTLSDDMQFRFFGRHFITIRVKITFIDIIIHMCVIYNLCNEHHQPGRDTLR